MTEKEKRLNQELNIGAALNAQLMRAYQSALERNTALEAENDHEEVRRRTVQEFTTNILHGDDEHRQWLLEAAGAFINRRPIPQRRG